IYIIIGLYMTFHAKECNDIYQFWKCMTANEIGDWLAGFFAPLAFLGITATVLIQGKELELQRAELRLTKNELKRAADAQDNSQLALNKTIYAQTFKVALDILEAKEIITDRRDLLMSDRHTLAKPENMTMGLSQIADRVSRGFESVGTLVRKGLVPSEYITDTWSVVIDRNWKLLRPYIYMKRREHNDAYLGIDFEYLSDLAEKKLLKDSIKPFEPLQ
ncbi:MAG: hypothetical protein WAT78_12170, partial [Rhizobiaceae bacterium]